MAISKHHTQWTW